MKERFIRLNKIITSKSTKPIDVQASRVTYVEDYHEDHARVHFGPEDNVRVIESREEVLRRLHD